MSDLENRTGVAFTGAGTAISITKLLQMAGDARLLEDEPRGRRSADADFLDVHA